MLAPVSAAGKASSRRSFDSPQAEAFQLLDQIGRQRFAFACQIGEIGRRVAGFEITPSLKGPSGVTAGFDEQRIEYQPAAGTIHLIAVVPEFKKLLAGCDVASDDPIYRPAVQKLGLALRPHARAVEDFSERLQAMGLEGAQMRGVVHAHGKFD
jgi:hypothetical protein